MSAQMRSSHYEFVLAVALLVAAYFAAASSATAQSKLNLDRTVAELAPAAAAYLQTYGVPYETRVIAVTTVAAQDSPTASRIGVSLAPAREQEAKLFRMGSVEFTTFPDRRVRIVPDSMVASLGFNAEAALKFFLPDAGGARVTGLAEGAPAKTGGIRIGDIVKRVEGTPIKSPEDLTRVVRAHRPGSKIKIELLRPKTSACVQSAKSQHADRYSAILHASVCHWAGNEAGGDRWLKRAATDGDVEAEFAALGPTPMHLSSAENMKSLQRLADAGYVEAQSNYGALLYGRRDIANAKLWLTKAASADDSHAYFTLGRLIERHEPGHEAEAVQMYLRAAQKGLFQGRLALAHARAFGIGTPAAPQTAARDIYVLAGVPAGFQLPSQLVGTWDAWPLEFRRELQSLLRDGGFWSGPVDGRGEPELRRALERRWNAAVKPN